MDFLTNEHLAQIKEQLQVRKEEELKRECMLALRDTPGGEQWQLVKIGDTETVDARECLDAKAWLHTHPVRSYSPLIPSALDMQVMASSDKPHGIMNYCSHEDVVSPCFWHSSIQASTDSLLGRLYRWGDYGSDGKGDCYALVKDWLRLNKGVVLPMIPRDFHDAYGYYYTMNCLEHTKVVPFTGGVNSLQEGDIIVVRMGRQGEHGGVYIGNGMMLHHPINSVSKITPASRYVQHLHLVLRPNALA